MLRAQPSRALPPLRTLVPRHLWSCPQPRSCPGHRCHPKAKASCPAPRLAQHTSALELPCQGYKRCRLRRPRCRWFAAGACPASSRNVTASSGKSRESPPESRAIAFLFSSQCPFRSQLPSSLRRAASAVPPLCTQRCWGAAGAAAISRGCQVPCPCLGARCGGRALALVRLIPPPAGGGDK